jgi:flagellar biosynthesis protein FlhG
MRQRETVKAMSRLLTITSGKGGVGKTNISLNLALQLSKLGHRTCLFDADLGLANINILLGLQPEHSLRDVIFNDRSLNEILIRGQDGVDILPGSSGVEEIANLQADQVEHLIDSFSQLADYEFVIIDTSAGIAKDVVAFCLGSPEVLIVITPEPTSLTDAFALLKVLALNGFRATARVVVNQCPSASVAKVVYQKFRSAVEKHLDMQVTPVGMIVQDPKVTEAVKQQRPLISIYPESNATKCIKKLAERILTQDPQADTVFDMGGFWRRSLELFTRPFNIPGRDKKKESTPEATKDQPASGMPSHHDAVSPETPGADSAGEGLPTSENETISEVEATIIETRDAGKAGGWVTQDQPILHMLAKIADGLISVSKEIQQMHKTMSGNGEMSHEAEGNRNSASKDSGVTPIRCDLEAFLKTQNQNGKESSNGQ